MNHPGCMPHLPHLPHLHDTLPHAPAGLPMRTVQTAPARACPKLLVGRPAGPGIPDHARRHHLPAHAT
eukprot:2090130-Alexandrium_andersonii.AAC.1